MFRRHLTITLHGAALGAIALALCAVPASRAAAQAIAAPSAVTADNALKDLPVSPADRASYVGTYSGDSPEGKKMTLVIVEENGKLVGTMNGADPSRLLSQGPGVMRPEMYPTVSVTFTVQDGHATKITMRQGERVMEMPRVP
jgi:hypothetical protein